MVTGLSLADWAEGKGAQEDQQRHQAGACEEYHRECTKIEPVDSFRLGRWQNSVLCRESGESVSKIEKL
jgi:hypothetical protein